MDRPPELRRALDAFDAHRFVTKHQGHKETPSAHTFEYLLPCPRCNSSRLRWNNKKHTFICWGCRLTGDTLFLIQIMERIDEIGALDYVIDGYVGGDANLELSQLIGAAPQKERVRARQLPHLLWPEGVELLTSPCAPHQEAWGYLERRGLTTAAVKAYKLGYGRSGWHARYLIFPVFMGSKLVYYQGRATWDPPTGLSGEDRKQWIKATGYRKTLNPPTLPGYATASEVLFNYDSAKHYSHIVICEGPIDAIKVGPHAVALFGKAYSPQKVDCLMKTQARKFTVYLDRGEEEWEAANRLAAQLAALGEVYLAVPPEGRDAGDLTQDENAMVLAHAEKWAPSRLASNLLI